jgi:hypothetical protein
MSKYSIRVRKIINNRAKITVDKLPQACQLIFGLALSDEKAAAVLVENPNRLTQNFEQFIPESKLIQFAKQYPKLRKKLIVNANLSRSLSEKILNLDSFLRPNPATFLGFDDRTKLAIQFNPNAIINERRAEVLYQGAYYPIVTRHTRDFNKKIL